MVAPTMISSRVTRLINSRNGDAGADGGERALEMLAHADYDLLILDMIMPGMDGLEVCRRARDAVTPRLRLATAGDRRSTYLPRRRS